MSAHAFEAWVELREEDRLAVKLCELEVDKGLPNSVCGAAQRLTSFQQQKRETERKPREAKGKGREEKRGRRREEGETLRKEVS